MSGPGLSGGGGVVNAVAACFSWVSAGLVVGPTFQSPGQSATHGARFFLLSAQKCIGARFYWATGGLTKTVKVAAWDTNSILLASKTITMTVDGVHVLAWPIAFTANGYSRITFSFHDTATSGWLYSSWSTASTTPAFPTSNVPQILGPYRASENAGLFSLGDACPTTTLNGSDVIPIEPVLATDSYTLTD